jgi:hypothetical protein
MATVNYSNTQAGAQDGSCILYTWALTTANADGASIQAPEWSDRTWQAQGTWGGATLTIQGSNDGTNWFTLYNAATGVPITFTANGGATPIELPLYMRPNLTTAGSGATVTVTMLARRAQPLRT